MNKTSAEILEELIRKGKKLKHLPKYSPVIIIPKEKIKVNRENTKYPNITFACKGWRKSAGSVKIGVNYVLKKTNTLMTNDFFLLSTDKEIKEDMATWNLLSNHENLKKGKKLSDIKKSNSPKKYEENLKNRQMAHFILSLPEDIKIDNVIMQQMVVESMNAVIGNQYKMLVGIHNDTKNQHAHIILNTKSELTGKQVRMDKDDFHQIKMEFYSRCKERDIPVKDRKATEWELCKTREEKQALIDRMRNSRLKLQEDKHKQQSTIRIPDYVKMKCPNWSKSYSNRLFKNASTSNAMVERLNQLGMSVEHQQSFLNLYFEDKQVANSLINNQPWFFGIKKPKEKFDVWRAKVEIEGIDNINKEVMYKLPWFVRKQAPKWASLYENGSFDKELNAPKALLDKLKELGMDEKHQKAFLALYLEDKKLANYLINQHPDIFGISKPKEKLEFYTNSKI